MHPSPATVAGLGGGPELICVSGHGGDFRHGLTAGDESDLVDALKHVVDHGGTGLTLGVELDPEGADLH